MRVPDEVLTHLAAIFAGITAALGMSWFANLTRRVDELTACVSDLSDQVRTLTDKNRQLRRRIQDLGGENSETIE